MKILLLGEFSGLHAALRDGLRALGHEAFVASYGDVWKKIECDIPLGSWVPGLMGKAIGKVRPLWMKNKLYDFDIVQVICPLIFNGRFGLNRHLLDGIFKSAGKKFFCAAGDTYHVLDAREKFRYYWIEDYIKYDYKGKMPFWYSKSGIAQTDWLIEQVDGITPVAFEYSVAYEELRKKQQFIPMPVNVEKMTYRENSLRDKLVVFHGLNREGAKGTRHVRSAFNKLREKYPNDLELIIDGNMPLSDYLKLIERVNVVIDQTSGYSLGMNALFSMAMGKVVLGGAEPESLAILGVEKTPAVNILPDADDIVTRVEEVLDRRKELPEWGMASRKYVEDHHAHIKVAQQYLDFWGK